MSCNNVELSTAQEMHDRKPQIQAIGFAKYVFFLNMLLKYPGQATMLQQFLLFIYFHANGCFLAYVTI